MLKNGWVIGLMLAGICVSSQSVLGMESKSDKCIITENNTDEIVSFLNENVKENLKQNVYKTIIPRNVRLAEAPSHGLPINMYEPKSAGAVSYRNLAKEVIDRYK